MTCPPEAELALYAGRDAPDRRIAKVDRHNPRDVHAARTRVAGIWIGPVCRGIQRFADAPEYTR